MNSKVLFPVMLLAVLFWNCSKSGSDLMIQQEINQNWQFSQAGKNEWLPATVPGTVHTDLMANKKIEDPYYRLNEHSLQWIDKVDWEYKTTFVADENFLKYQSVELCFEGIDTYASVFVNDKLLFQADNMFRIVAIFV